MMHPSKIHRLLFAAFALLLVSVPSATAAGKGAYGAKDLTFKEIKLREDGAVRITFTSLAETLYYCPGANAKVTGKGVELTFVRSRIKKKPKVDYPAKTAAAGGGTKVITVPAKEGAVYLRDGKKLVKLHPKDDD